MTAGKTELLSPDELALLARLKAERAFEGADITNTLQSLLDYGLCTCRDIHDERHYYMTAKGKEHIDALLGVPLPHSVYVSPARQAVEDSA